MVGGIIQLVANGGAQNRYIDQEPQITLFKTVYRRHSPFSFEHVNIPFKGQLKFGGRAEAELLPGGDLLGRIFVVLEIPKLAAAFLNTKSADLIQLLTGTTYADQIFDTRIKKYVNTNSTIEIGKTINIIDDTLSQYDIEDHVRLNVLNDLALYVDPIGEVDITDTQPYVLPEYGLEGSTPAPTTKISVPDLSTIPNLDINSLDAETKPLYDFVNFKTVLSTMWTNSISEPLSKRKKQFYLTHRLLEIYYAGEIVRQIPLIDSTKLTNSILYAEVFYDLVPSREILLMYWLKNEDFVELQDEKQDSLIEVFSNGLDKLNKNIVDNLSSYQVLNQIFNPNVDLVPIVNPDFTLSPKAFNTHEFLRKVTYSLGNDHGFVAEAQEIFYNYGPMFTYMLNGYNTILNIIKNFATTTPIITMKAFALPNPLPTDSVYTPGANFALYDAGYPTILDPNFKAGFLLDVNSLEQPNRDIQFPHNFVPEFTTPNQALYPSAYVNQYLQLFNSQTISTMNNIERNMQTLFEFYYTNNYLFNNVSSLYYLQDPLNASQQIYFYSLPTTGFQDPPSVSPVARVFNTFNINVFFFFFFKYLDSIDEMAMSRYFNDTLGLDLSPNALLFLQAIVVLLKKNIEFYMNEISYYLNDLNSNTPSTIASNTNTGGAMS
jgi:hypothetical protein